MFKFKKKRIQVKVPPISEGWKWSYNHLDYKIDKTIESVMTVTNIDTYTDGKPKGFYCRSEDGNMSYWYADTVLANIQSGEYKFAGFHPGYIVKN